MILILVSLSTAIAGYPPEHAREVALYLSWLSESLARIGEFDAARGALGRARRHAAQMPSARTEHRLKAAERLVSAATILVPLAAPLVSTGVITFVGRKLAKPLFQSIIVAEYATSRRGRYFALDLLAYLSHTRMNLSETNSPDQGIED